MQVGRRTIILAAIGLGLAPAALAASLDRAVVPVADAIKELLLGDEPDRRDPLEDPPLLAASGPDRAVLAADRAAFVKTIGERVKPADVQALEKAILKALDRPVKKRGFRVEGVAYPPVASDPRTLTIALEPLTELGAQRRDGQRPTLLLIRMSVCDSTGKLLARRDFYSGYDLEDFRPARPRQTRD